MTTVVKRVARAVLIDDDQRLLLIKRAKPGQEPYWTAPGGGVEPTLAGSRKWFTCRR